MISGYIPFLFEWTHIKNTTPKRNNEKYYVNIIFLFSVASYGSNT
jgi:hypothetical protein